MNSNFWESVKIALDPKVVEAFEKFEEKLDRLPARYKIIDADYREIITDDSKLLEQGIYGSSKLS